MECRNHTDKPAADRCAACCEPFCHNCLVKVQGKRYCASCKTVALPPNALLLEPSLPCKEADEAFKYAIAGLFCFGIALGPLAIDRALKARRAIEADPRLAGWSKANVGMVLGVVAFLLSCFVFLSRFAR